MLLTWSLQGSPYLHDIFLVIFKFDIHMCLKNETICDFIQDTCWWRVTSRIFFIQVRICCIWSKEVRSKVHQGWETVYRDQLTQSHSRKAICFQEGLNLLAVLVLQMRRDQPAAFCRAVWEEISNSSWFSCIVSFYETILGKKDIFSFQMFLVLS